LVASQLGPADQPELESNPAFVAQACHWSQRARNGAFAASSVSALPLVLRPARGSMYSVIDQNHAWSGLAGRPPGDYAERPCLGRAASPVWCDFYIAPTQIKARRHRDERPKLFQVGSAPAGSPEDFQASGLPGHRIMLVEC